MPPRGICENACRICPYQSKCTHAGSPIISKDTVRPICWVNKSKAQLRAEHSQRQESLAAV